MRLSPKHLAAWAPGLAIAAALAGPALAADPDAAVPLDQIVVLAGQFPTGQQPGSVLSGRDILLTPGANADIDRTLQLLPGVQQVDDGNALYVRGGASDETITRVNGLVFPSPINFAAPTGTLSETLDVFEARRIDFASGGFDARFGNALSGVVDLDSIGAPRADSLVLGAGLGGASLGGGLVFGGDGGVQLTAARTDTAPILALNGSPRRFPNPPNGYNVGLSAGIAYRPDAEIKVFALELSQRFAVVDYAPGDQGVFRRADTDRFGALSWQDRFGDWAAELSLGGGSVTQRMTGPDFALATSQEHRQAAGRVRYLGSDRLEGSIGFDGMREASSLARSLSPAAGPGAGSAAFALPDSRWGLYTVLDSSPFPSLRALFSARADSSTLTERVTADPRFSLTWQAAPHLSLFLAGGAYRQTPAPFDCFDASGRVVLPPLQDRQASGGLQWSRAGSLIRVEAYRKNYSDLVALDRSYLPVPFGQGFAQGLDAFLKWPLPAAFSGRLAYSYGDSLRTDPNTGVLAPAPFDVRHTASLVVQRVWAKWTASGALRSASGRPFTPVVGAVPDGVGGFAPVYGPPGAQRLPPFWRVDLDFTHRSDLGRHVTLVEYLSVENLLNRDNAAAYGYPADYSSRFLVPSLFNRCLYFGVSLAWH